MTQALDALNNSNPNPQLRVLLQQARVQQAMHASEQAAHEVAALEQATELAQINATRANLHVQDLVEQAPRNTAPPITYSDPRPSEAWRRFFDNAQTGTLLHETA